jgi:hypothetical protein
MQRTGILLTLVASTTLFLTVACGRREPQNVVHVTPPPAEPQVVTAPPPPAAPQWVPGQWVQEGPNMVWRPGYWR